MEGMKPIPDRVFFRIGDVADIVGVKPYVLRYWESEFSMISPEKSSTGQRVYRRTDVEALVMIKNLLYEERYSIEGAKKRIRELRKEGALKSYKQEKVEASVASGASSQAGDAREESFKMIREVSQELQTLIQRPLAELFRY